MDPVILFVTVFIQSPHTSSAVDGIDHLIHKTKPTYVLHLSIYLNLHYKKLQNSAWRRPPKFTERCRPSTIIYCTTWPRMTV